MKVHGTEGMSDSDINYALGRGAKFVNYQYCISILIMTFKRSSDIYFIQAGENSASKGIKFTIITLLFGWWGIPWGPIYSISSLVTNLSGGKDLTDEICQLNGFQPQ